MAGILKMINKSKHEMLVQRTRARFPYLIHIYNEDLGDFYYCNCDKDMEYDGHSYTAGVFEITPPERTDTSIGNAMLRISSVDMQWIRKIRQTQKRSRISFVASIEYYDNGQKIIEPVEDNEYTLVKATWDGGTMIQWEMIFDEDMDINCPPDIAGPMNCAGCC